MFLYGIPWIVAIQIKGIRQWSVAFNQIYLINRDLPFISDSLTFNNNGLPQPLFLIMVFPLPVFSIKFSSFTIFSTFRASICIL